MKFNYDPSLPGLTSIRMVLEHLKNAFFISLVVSGVGIALLGEAHFRLVARVVCPPGAVMSYNETYDGESNVVTAYCVQGGQSQEQTLGFIGAIYGLYVAAFFLPPLVAGIIIRLIRKREKD